MDIGVHGTMLLFIVVMQLGGLIKQLAGMIWNTAKKREEDRDNLIAEVAQSIQEVKRDIHILKLTMLNEEDIKKSIQLEVYKMREGMNQ